MANENASGAVKSGVLLKLLPENLVCKPSENGRFEEPDRRPLIIEVLQEGRILVPLEGRKIEQNQVQVVSGYGRYTAATFINSHLTDGVLEQMLQEAGLTGVTVPTSPIKLPIIVETMSAEEAFFRNLKENDGGRAPTTFVDKAFNLRRAIQVYGKTEEEARYIYKNADGTPKSPAWVTQMLKITSLDKRILADIIKAEGSANICFTLADMPEDARAEVLALATQTAEAEGTPITASGVTEAARKLGKNTKKVGRKLKQVKDMLEDFINPENGRPQNCQKFCKTLLDWINDDADDDVLMRATKLRFKESEKD